MKWWTWCVAAPLILGCPGAPGTVDGSSDASSSEGGAGVCGDGIVDADEECDDANEDEEDGCHSDCTAAGATFWKYTFDAGGMSGSGRAGVAADEQSVYVVARAEPGVKLVRLDPDGELAWTLVSGEIHCDQCDVALTSQGAAVIGGEVANQAMRIVAVAPDETTLWVRDFGWSLSDLRIVNDAAGDVVVAHPSDQGNGTTVSRVSAEGDVIDSLEIPEISYVSGFAPTTNGGFVILEDSGGGWLVVEITPDLELGWGREHGNTDTLPGEMFSDGKGGVFVSVWDEPAGDIELFHVKPDGSLDDRVSLDFKGYEHASDGAAGADGSFYLVGSGGAGITEMFYAKLDQNYDPIWHRPWTGNGATDITLVADRAYVVGSLDYETVCVRAVEL